MLESVKISRRQSEIREALAGLVGKEKPSEDETRSITDLDAEYRTNETRYRAALIAEDTERTEAGRELEGRSETEWNALMGKFELRQVALHFDQGQALDGATGEIVSELRAQGGYRGVPVPWEALEMRASETFASATPDPVRTMPIIDRLFATSVAARMGGAMINVGAGEVEYPVSSSQVAAGWAATEAGSVPADDTFATVDRPLKPDHTLGVQIRLTRKTLKQSGQGIEQAVRRDMNGAISEAMDKAVFLGTGADGQPTGLFTGASAWGITETAVDAAASYAAFRAAATRFMVANAASGLDQIRLLLRPEVYDAMDAALITGTAVSEWDRLSGKIPKLVLSSNALAAPAGDPAETSAILTTSVAGVPPFFVGAWGAIDMIRDPYTDAQAGGLRLTALTTMDVTISRAVQTEILTGVQ